MSVAINDGLVCEVLLVSLPPQTIHWIGKCRLDGFVAHREHGNN